MILYFIGLVLLNNQLVESLTCKSEKGADDDWTAIYKPPNSALNSGKGYLYTRKWYEDAGWTLSGKSLGDANSMPERTFYEFYGNYFKFNYIMYNNIVPDDVLDSYPLGPKGTSNRYSSAKVLIWNNKFSLWIVHSIPKYPPKVKNNRYSFPQENEANGHIFLCLKVELNNIENILKNLMLAKVRVYDRSLSQDYLAKLAFIQEKIYGRSNIDNFTDHPKTISRTNSRTSVLSNSRSSILSNINSKFIDRFRSKTRIEATDIMDKKIKRTNLCDHLSIRGGREYKIITRHKKGSKTLWEEILECTNSKKIWVKSNGLMKKPQKNRKILNGNDKDRCNNLANINDISYNSPGNNINLSWKMDFDNTSWGISFDTDCFCITSDLNHKKDPGHAVCLCDQSLHGSFKNLVNNLSCKVKNYV